MIRSTYKGPRLSPAAYGKQVKFATALAINQTLEDIQSETRRGLRSHFTLRQPAFIERLIKIRREDFARRDKLTGQVGVQGPKAHLLAQFEEGGPKVVRGEHVALPMPAVKRSKFDIITAGQRPRPLIARGKAFVLPQKSGQGEVVLQRVGRGKHKRNVALYVLERKRPILPASLRFFQTARYVATRVFRDNLRASLDRALRTARPE